MPEEIFGGGVPTCRACAREHKRKLDAANHAKDYERTRSDPKLWAEYLASCRMNYRLRQERKGKPVAPVSEVAYNKRYGDGKNGHGQVVPAEPLRILLEQWLPEDAQARNGMGDSENCNLSALAEIADVSARRLYSVLYGKQDMVSVRLADHVCVALDVPFSLLYQEQS